MAVRFPPQCPHAGTALLAPAPTCEGWVVGNLGVPEKLNSGVKQSNGDFFNILFM